MSEAEFPSARPQEAVDAELVCDDDFLIYDVQEAAESGLTHFLDGAQKVWKVMYYGFDPVVLAHTSAAVVARTERQMLALPDADYSGALDAIGVDVPLLRERFKGTCDSYFPIAIPEHWSPVAVGEQIREQVGVIRKSHEISVATNFQEGFLLVDGPIGEVAAVLQGREYAGLVKSHGRLYVKDPQ